MDRYRSQRDTEIEERTAALADADANAIGREAWSKRECVDVENADRNPGGRLTLDPSAVRFDGDHDVARSQRNAPVDAECDLNNRCRLRETNRKAAADADRGVGRGQVSGKMLYASEQLRRVK